MEGEVSIEIIPIQSAIFWNYIKNSILKLLDNGMHSSEGECCVEFYPFGC